MTGDEFRAWLDDEVAGERMTGEQRDDLLRQKELFDRAFPAGFAARRRDVLGQIVGYVADVQLVEPEIHRLLDRARSMFPGRMVYFEPIGFDLF